MVNETGIIANQRTRTDLNLPCSSIDLVGISEAIDILIAEVGDGFYNYLDWIGLAKDPNLIVLSSFHNYFYDTDELNNVNTVINLKELNKIKRIKSLFQDYLHFLPQKCNLIGYFIDNKKFDRYVLRNSSSYFDKKRRFDEIENSIISRNPFINMLYTKMDLKTNTYMSKCSVTSLLEIYGFKVMDMTEHNDLTFFYSQKVGNTYN